MILQPIPVCVMKVGKDQTVLRKAARSAPMVVSVSMAFASVQVVSPALTAVKESASWTVAKTAGVSMVPASVNWDTQDRPAERWIVSSAVVKMAIVMAASASAMRDSLVTPALKVRYCLRCL